MRRKISVFVLSVMMISTQGIAALSTTELTENNKESSNETIITDENNNIEGTEQTEPQNEEIDEIKDVKESAADSTEGDASGNSDDNKSLRNDNVNLSTEMSVAAANPYPGNINSNCTYAAWQKTKEITGVELPGWGHAGDWYSAAAAAGYSVGTTPRANSIVVFKKASWNENYGHVAFVTDYNASNGTIYKLEGNYNGAYHEGWGPAWESDMYGYIYIDSSANNPPVGSLDLCQGSMGSVRVAGWARDDDDPGAQIEVHVYVGGPCDAAGVEGHPFRANGSRPDVGNHAFDITFNTRKTGQQDVYVYAIDSAGGANKELGHTSINIGNPNPIGVIDSVTDKGGCIQVNGWTFDPSDKSKQLTVHVYIGGPAGSGAELHAITADTKRTDVNKAYDCGDYHGFSALIQTNKSGSQPVYVYGINTGNGWENTCLGYKTTNITKLKRTGWQKIDGEWYYFRSDGQMATNVWAKDSKGWCWMDASGRITKSKWIKTGGEWYYLKSNGYMAANEWAKDSGGWYWMNASGKIAKNVWAKDSGGWYWMNGSGRIAKNAWAKDSKGWCWMGSNGRMVKSKWVKYRNDWYYLNASGYMVTGTQKIGGKTYKFDKSGKLIS